MIADKISEKMKSASWIRAMFEEGEKLRKIHGAAHVFDFTLGNPYTEPPQAVRQSIIRLVTEENAHIHKYMHNAGYEDVRAVLAQSLSQDCGLPLTAAHLVMTVGAAGALNVILKTILNPGDEVIILAPYFVEYLFYIDNHGGVPVVVHTQPDTFQPDIAAIEKRITPKTKAIIINTPNNPSGVIYKKDTLSSLAKLLEKKESEYASPIFLISDEPYREIYYEAEKLPSVLSLFKNALVAYSYSKSLSLAGERIGYIAASPRIEDVEQVMAGFTFCNRTLGFVNAPSLFQKVLKDIQGIAVDVSEYKENRDLLYNVLIDIGFVCPKPEGAFFLFPKALGGDDVAFAKTALRYHLLLVPGSGFGTPGHVRLSYCVPKAMIENAIPAFRKLYAFYEGRDFA